MIAKRLGLIIMGILLFSIIVIFFSMYRTNYKEITIAAGVEAFGCANITTALINPDDLNKIKAGDKEVAERVGEDISWTIQHKNIFEGQYVMDLDKKLLAVDENLLGQGFKPGDDFYMEEDVLEQLLITKAPVYGDVYEFGGMERLTGYAPIFEDHDPDKEIVAISAIDFEASILHSRTWDMIKGSFFVAIIPILLAGFITIYLINRTIAPLKTISTYARNVAEGDLTQAPLEVKGNDEIAALSQDLNTMTSNLKEMIGELTTTSTEVATVSQNLAENTEEAATVAQQNLASTTEVHDGSQEQLEIVEEQDRLLTTIFEKIKTMSDKLEELTNVSNQTTDQASQGDEMIAEATTQMDQIQTNTSNLANSMHDLSKKSEAINDIITIISGIAESTNMLALNASIEAARAGESGKGFAVVAAEIRTLAEQSHEATKEISDLIHEIQTETMTAVNEMETNQQVVATGTEGIHDAGQAFGRIRESIHEVTTEIHEVNEETIRLTDEIGQIVQAMGRIEAISTENAANVHAVQEHSEEQAEAITEMTNYMADLAALAEELRGKTRQFRM